MAVTFTGSTYLSTTSVPGGLNQNTAAHTFAMWVYATNNSGSVVDSLGNSACFCGVVGSGTTGSSYTDAVWIGSYSGNGLCNWDQQVNNFAEEAFTLPGLTMPLNTWTHVAGTFDGTNAVAYVNGASVGTRSTGGTATAIAWNRLVVGGFNGAGQDAWIFNRALSQIEVQALMRGRLFPGSRTSLVGHWPLLGGGQSGIDWSGNGRNLTATGSCPDDTKNAPVSWNTRTVLQALRSSAVNLSIAGSGTTNATGAAALSSSAGLAAAGTTQVTGTAAITKSAGIIALGSVQTTGAGALAATAGITAAGVVNATGAAGLTSAAPLAAAGLVQTTGSSSLAGSLLASGTTNVTGAAAINPTWPLAAAGSTQVSGAAALTVGFAITASGLVACAGSAAFDATASSGNLAEQTPVDRRWLGSLAARRRLRR